MFYVVFLYNLLKYIKIKFYLDFVLNFTIFQNLKLAMLFSDFKLNSCLCWFPKQYDIQYASVNQF